MPDHLAAPRAPRNLVVFADGTGQDGGTTHNTNVYKMFSLAEDRTDRQLCYYHAGVGTSGKYRSLGLGGGFGFAGNVRACYDFLHEEYKSGDRIFLFGFSRGAATVRSLAYFIHLFGILPRSRRSLVRRAWSIYTIRDKAKRLRKAKQFVTRNPTMWTKVHFIGCYDTVAALGAPFQWMSRVIDHIPGFKHRFHDLRLSPSVVHAYHALALDDERRTFHPLLWDPLEAEQERRANNPMVEPLACETMRQVWFMGMHSDVGGGYSESSLSDIPLVWLTDNAVAHGLRVYAKHRVGINEDANGVMHDARTGFGQLFRKAPRTWNNTRLDQPIVHASTSQRSRDKLNRESAYMTWIASLSTVTEPWERYRVGQWVETPGAELP